MIIRDAANSDLEEINNIYNHAVEMTTATFDTEKKDIEYRRRWLEEHDAVFSAFVAEIDGRVAGWASLNRFSDRKAYDSTSENSLYVSPEFKGRGVGKKLLEETVRRAEKAGLRTIIAKITEDNIQSISMHDKAGFFNVGVMKEVGIKFGKVLDVRIMQKMIDREAE